MSLPIQCQLSGPAVFRVPTQPLQLSMSISLTEQNLSVCPTFKVGGRGQSLLTYNKVKLWNKQLK